MPGRFSNNFWEAIKVVVFDFQRTSKELIEIGISRYVFCRVFVLENIGKFFGKYLWLMNFFSNGEGYWLAPFLLTISITNTFLKLSENFGKSSI